MPLNIVLMRSDNIMNELQRGRSGVSRKNSMLLIAMLSIPPLPFEREATEGMQHSHWRQDGGRDLTAPQIKMDQRYALFNLSMPP